MDYTFFIFFPVIIGIGGLMTFLLNGRWHQLHDKIYLALLVCIVFTIYTTIRAMSTTDDYAYIALDNIETLVGLSICPLFFLYIASVTHDTKWHKWYWWLFVPAIFIWVVGSILSIRVGWDRILAVRQNDYAPFVPNPERMVEKLYLIFNIKLFNVTFELMTVTLIGFSIYHLAAYNRQSENYFANIEESRITNRKSFLFLGILFFLILFLLTFYIRNVIALGNKSKLAISFCLSAIMVMMIYNAYQLRMTVHQVEAIDMAQGLHWNLGGEYNKSGDQGDNIGIRISAWETRKDKPFCKEGITLAEVAKEIGVNTRTLSEYINKQKGVNFNAWINTLRVEEAKRLLRMSQALKIGYISDICGFGTQPTFSKTFRQIEGMTPQSYRESTTHLV